MSNKKKLTSLILLIAILLFGAYVRGYRLFEWMPWEPDVGRDMVVARHMAMGDGPRVLHVTSGSSSGFVVNSPVYFWVTTQLFRLTNSPHGVAIFYVAWSIVGIVLSYYIGKINNNIPLGLFYAFLISSNYIMVKLSQKTWQQSILPTLTILNIFLLQVTLKKIQLISVLALITASFLGLHFHVSFYPIFIINTLWIVFLIFHLLKKNVFHGLLCIVCYISHIILWISITSPNEQITPLKHIEWAAKSVTLNSYITQLTDIIRTILSITFFNSPLILSASITAVLFILLMFLMFTSKQKSSLETITTLYLFTLLGLALYPEPFFYGRLMIYFPLILLMIALVIVKFKKYRAVQALFVIIVIVLSSHATLSVFTDAPPNQYTEVKNVVEAIYADYSSMTIGSTQTPSIKLLSIEDSQEQLEWYTGQYWYILESITQKRLVNLIESGNNLSPIVNNPTYYYLICYPHADPATTVETICIPGFLNWFGDKVSPHHVPILSSGGYYVFRWESAQ